jgi:hypothetical protein
MSDLDRIRPEELDAEEGMAIPDKEVMSLLDLFVNIDLALDLAAPIDLAVAANANAALPIDASVTANVLSSDSTAQAMSTQAAAIGQHLNADAIAHAPQDAAVDQGNDVVDGGAPAADGTPDAGTPSPVESGTTSAIDPVTGELVDVPVDQLMSDGLLNVDVNVSLDADIAAPIAGAVAANANVAAPIDGSVAANIASTGSTATAIADQTAVIDQTIEDSTAQATAEQTADIQQ